MVYVGDNGSARRLGAGQVPRSVDTLPVTPYTGWVQSPPSSDSARTMRAARLVGMLALLCLLWSAAPAWAQQDPIIRASDEVEVRIPGTRRVDERVIVVDRYGEINLVNYGRVGVEGMTEAEAREALVTHLSRYVRDTAVVDLVIHRRIRHVLVTGQVQEPGLLSVEGEPDVWIAIQQAGGALPGADIGRIQLFRNGEEIAVDVHGYLTGTVTEPMPELLSGDTVFVPADAGMPTVTGSPTAFLTDEALQSRVFVLGAVEAPGVFERMPSLNSLTALALAGGATARADLENARLITAEGSVRVDFEAILLGQQEPAAIPEGAGVILFVPERAENGSSSPFGQQIRLLGRTAFQGTINVSGPVRLIELLGDAGGFARDADLDEVHIIREGRRSSVALHYQLEDYLHEGGTLGSVWVYPGDVLFIDVLPDSTVWQTIVGAVRDLAIVSSAVYLWVQIANGT